MVLDEIISYMDNPAERIYDEFEARIFKGNSLGYNTLGTKESVSGFKREDILNYVERYFKPGNMVISFVGDISLDEVRRVLEDDFGSMPSGDVDLKGVKIPDFESFKLIEKKSNFQTHTVIWRTSTVVQ